MRSGVNIALVPTAPAADIVPDVLPVLHSF